MIRIYCDGSTKTNPGPGAFGVVILDDNDNILYIYRKEYESTTNNRMELEGLIHALEKYQEYEYNASGKVTIYCDSAYCVNMYNDWIDSWYTNGWRRSKNQEIENLDLVQLLYKIKYENLFVPTVKKVKGHNGDFGNELCDAVAADNKPKMEKLTNKIQKVKIVNEEAKITIEEVAAAIDAYYRVLTPSIMLTSEMRQQDIIEYIKRLKEG